ncbi:hypothetical protein Spa11_36260 [Botrimarina mediterranea]|uniref:Uncharacterized protein n=1 Tax=Botrimarina mediterranea TaxID=2528022 RepID=A0A518KCC9_9BACT|nr:hypothetical protein Spa11_36260 [Botrimarina mediterranea]
MEVNVQDVCGVVAGNRIRSLLDTLAYAGAKRWAIPPISQTPLVSSLSLSFLRQPRENPVSRRVTACGEQVEGLGPVVLGVAAASDP